MTMTAIASVLAAAIVLKLKKKQQEQKKEQETTRKRKCKYLLNELVFDNSWKTLYDKKVILSLTTSPLRIDKVKDVLDNIHPSTYDVICINIPQKYKRTGEEYVIPEWMLTYPKLVINRIETDLGPITKVVPAMERFPDSFIVSIDDDIRYKPYFINLLGNVFLNELNRKKNNTGGKIIVAQRGTNFSSYWNHLKKKNKSLVEEASRLFHSPKIEKNKDKNTYKTRNFDYRLIELIEGFGGIMYSPMSYNQEIVNKLKELSSLSKACFQSDDMVLSVCFSYYNVKKITLQYIPPVKLHHMIKELEYGMGHDALHKIQNHSTNYIQALKDMVHILQ